MLEVITEMLQRTLRFGSSSSDDDSPTGGGLLLEYLNPNNFFDIHNQIKHIQQIFPQKNILLFGFTHHLSCSLSCSLDEKFGEHISTLEVILVDANHDLPTVLIQRYHDNNNNNNNNKEPDKHHPFHKMGIRWEQITSIHLQNDNIDNNSNIDNNNNNPYSMGKGQLYFLTLEDGKGINDFHMDLSMRQSNREKYLLPYINPSHKTVNIRIMGDNTDVFTGPPASIEQTINANVNITLYETDSFMVEGYTTIHEVQSKNPWEPRLPTNNDPSRNIFYKKSYHARRFRIPDAPPPPPPQEADKENFPNNDNNTSLVDRLIFDERRGGKIPGAAGDVFLAGISKQMWECGGRKANRMPYKYLISVLDDIKNKVIVGMINGEIYSIFAYQNTCIKQYMIQLVWTRFEFRGNGICTAVMKKAIENLPDDAFLQSGQASDCGGKQLFISQKCWTKLDRSSPDYFGTEIGILKSSLASIEMMSGARTKRNNNCKKSKNNVEKEHNNNRNHGGKKLALLPTAANSVESRKLSGLQPSSNKNRTESLTINLPTPPAATDKRGGTSPAMSDKDTTSRTLPSPEARANTDFRNAASPSAKRTENAATTGLPSPLSPASPATGDRNKTASVLAPATGFDDDDDDRSDSDATMEMGSEGEEDSDDIAFGDIDFGYDEGKELAVDRNGASTGDENIDVILPAPANNDVPSHGTILSVENESSAPSPAPDKRDGVLLKRKLDKPNDTTMTLLIQSPPSDDSDKRPSKKPRMDDNAAKAGNKGDGLNVGNKTCGGISSATRLPLPGGEVSVVSGNNQTKTDEVSDVPCVAKDDLPPGSPKSAGDNDRMPDPQRKNDGMNVPPMKDDSVTKVAADSTTTTTATTTCRPTTNTSLIGQNSRDSESTEVGCSITFKSRRARDRLVELEGMKDSIPRQAYTKQKKQLRMLRALDGHNTKAPGSLGLPSHGDIADDDDEQQQGQQEQQTRPRISRRQQGQQEQQNRRISKRRHVSKRCLKPSRK